MISINEMKMMMMMMKVEALDWEEPLMLEPS